MISLKTWLQNNLINYQVILNCQEFGIRLFSINDKKFFVILPKNDDEENDLNGILFDANFQLILNDDDFEIIDSVNLVDYIVFNFGGNYYYFLFEGDVLVKKVQILKYFGNIQEEDDVLPYVNLGIHSGYEILSGSGSYADYIKKAIFLKHNTLGICESNTLRGALAFQLECISKNIKPIIGATYDIQGFDDEIISTKFYVKNKTGWNNILKLNKLVNVDLKTLTLEDLLDYNEGLIVVLSGEWYEDIFLLLKDSIEDLYYQIRFTEYKSDEVDKESLLELKAYFHYHLGKIQPIYINDNYYLDQDVSDIKKVLHEIGQKRVIETSSEYYFSNGRVFEDFQNLFRQDVKYCGLSAAEIYKLSTENTIKISEQCNFLIDTKTLKLPKYTYEYEGYKGVDLFHHLINKGMERKIKNKTNYSEYVLRIEEESAIIVENGLHHYFLILWDVANFCRENNIYMGFGRGSAAGCLIAYLFDIVHIDAIEFDLLFERFLNKGRLKGSLPDIDSDFESLGRGRVKQYIQQKFGLTQVGSVGTYTTLALKGAFQDVARIKGISPQDRRFIGSMIESRESWEWFDLFPYAQSNSVLKKFVKEHVDIFNTIRNVLDQPKTSSIHAAAMIVVPSEDSEGNPMTIYDWMPVKLVDGDIVTEWEGTYLEKAGFLKNDILGIKQLDKFAEIVALVKKSGQEVDIYNIPYDDKMVYEYFRQGYLEDVFHFGAAGLKNYTTQVQPENINDLIAINALFRPGPININAHNQYILLKQGKRQPEYWPHTESITKSTYGLPILQEQIMQIVRAVANFSLVESDDVRRAIGKKDKVLMDKYRALFVQNAQLKDYSAEKANALWNDIEGFAQYSFNRSHAAAYSVTGYTSQYLKVYHPLQFWAVCLKYSSKEEIPLRLGEIVKTSSIKAQPPDINKSSAEFEIDIRTHTLYWSLSGIHQLGASAFAFILEERAKNGKYFSFEEFVHRVRSKSVRINVIENLIKAGAFDEIEYIHEPKDRLRLIEACYQIAKKNKEEQLVKLRDYQLKIYNYQWIRLQKEVSGYGYFDYPSIVSRYFKSKLPFCGDLQELEEQKDVKKEISVVVAGLILSVVDRNTKLGPIKQITAETNGSINIITLWVDFLENNDNLKFVEGAIIIINGRVRFDKFKNKNTLFCGTDANCQLL